MKVWKVATYHASEGCELSWHGNKVEAETAKKEREAREDFTGPSHITQQELGTNRAELIAWLNLNFTRDNG